MSPAEGEPVDLRVDVQFEPDRGGTLLRLIESGYPTEQQRDAALRDGSVQGLDFYQRTLPSAWD